MSEHGGSSDDKWDRPNGEEMSHSKGVTEQGDRRCFQIQIFRFQSKSKTEHDLDVQCERLQETLDFYMLALVFVTYSDTLPLPRLRFFRSKTP